MCVCMYVYLRPYKTPVSSGIITPTQSKYIAMFAGKYTHIHSK